MKVTIEKKYLVFPVSRNATLKNLRFYSNGGKCVFDLDLRLDFKTGTRDVYVDMDRFTGMTLDVSVFPEMKLEICEKDRKPVERFKQKLRPKYHFTAPEGWINDPNGLVCADGIYHMFYQLNPAGTGWGNMHWGHAVSKNLVDWECRPIALFPDETGAIFSGGAVADTKGILKPADSEKTPLILYYTAAGSANTASKGQPFTQCMAASFDGGESFVKYENNPIIEHIDENNRDPKVVYSDTLKKYIMSLYIKDDLYTVFGSKNLTEWERICNVHLPQDNECPAFFPVKNGEGVEKWILMGAHDRYIVGSFDGKEFIPEHEGSRIINCTGTNAYAAQKFENTGKRCIRIAWLKTDFEPYGEIYNGAMSFPQEVKLISTDDGDRLTFYPAEEIKKLQKKKEKISFEGCELKEELPGIALDINLTLDSINASGAEMTFFGIKFNLDFENGILDFGKDSMKFVPSADGKYRMRFLCDTCGIELFLSDGRYYGYINTLPDANLDTLLISSESKIKIKGEIFRLRDSRKADRRK